MQCGSAIFFGLSKCAQDLVNERGLENVDSFGMEITGP
jgi:hypothetical protein